MKRALNRKGLTLIEMLLSVVLFSLVSLSIYLVFSQGLKVEKRLRSSGVAGRDFYWPAQTIARDIERMVRYTNVEGESFFRGEHEEISFMMEGKNGLEEVQYLTVNPQMIDVYEVRVNSKATEQMREVMMKKEVDEQMMFLSRRTRPFSFVLNQKPFSEEILTERIVAGGFKLFYLTQDEQGSLLWEEKRPPEKPLRAVRIDITILDEQGLTRRTVRDVFIAGAMAEEVRDAW